MPLLNTLKKNKEFGFVYRKGKPIPRRDFTLIYAKSRYGGIRAGFSVSKKVGNSVQRNRARRRLKEAVRLVVPKAMGSYGVVFVARAGAVTADFSLLVDEVHTAFEKAGIIRKTDAAEGENNE